MHIAISSDYLPRKAVQRTDSALSLCSDSRLFQPASSLLRWSIGHKWPWSEVTNDDFVGRNKRASLFERHVEAELAGDLDTLATTTDPHLNTFLTMAGGMGREGVRELFRDHLIGKSFPP
jgi:hypothetical protein